MRVGVDIGGTFTDLVLEKEGEFHFHKLLSTPADPSLAMIAGLEQLLGEEYPALKRLAHGSTVATNAILQRRGSRFALITTQGFRDLLVMGQAEPPRSVCLATGIAAALVAAGALL